MKYSISVNDTLFNSKGSDMKYNINPDELTLVVEHHGREITWSVEAYRKKTDLIAEDDGFSYLNAYIAYLSDKRQTVLFEQLVKIHDVFNSLGVPDVKYQKLKEHVVAFVELIDAEHLHEWVTNVSTIPIPTSLKGDYSSSDRDRDKTYLRYEYSGLLVLALVGRFMLGILGEYMKQYSDRVGNEFKEYSAMRLLDDTWLNYYEATDRLRRYIQASIRQHSLSESAIIGGLSSFELSVFFLANIFIRRLAITPMDASLASGGLMAAVYKGYNTVKNNLSDKFSPLTDKTAMASDSRQEDGSNWSKLELYKITQQVGFDDLAIHKYMVNDTHRLAAQIDGTLPLAQLRECLANTTRRMGRFPLQDHAIILTQWVLRTHMPCRMIYNLDKPEVMQLMGLAQALLWHWGFHDIALLVTTEIDRKTLVSGSLSNRPKRQVKTSPMEEFNNVYPYHKLTRTASRDRNPAHAAISTFNESMLSCWLKNNPPSYMKAYAKEIEVDERGCLAPEDLITQLAEMLVYIEKRTVNTPN